MWFAYIDESKEAGAFYSYTALVTNGERWQSSFAKVKAFRQRLRNDYGIYLSKELHAWKFAAGKGVVADRVLSKDVRAKIFAETMDFLATSRTFVVVSSCNRVEQYAFERLINRLERTASRLDERLLLFFDQGEEAEIRRRLRRMRVHNMIPSRYGQWDVKRPNKNIPLASIVEDPIFRDSSASFMIQLADFCSYALFRMERPIASRSVLGYDRMYERLKPATRAIHNPRDPRGLGIIR